MRITLSTMCLCLFPVLAQAQTVQQPVVGSFGVTTTVSVPDRGQAHLGSIGTAGTSRTLTGPFRSGSNVGTFGSHSSASVGVTIHDFEAMDAMLLGTADASDHDASPSRATRAWSSLSRRRASSPRSISRSASRERTALSGTTSIRAVDDKAEKSFTLGQRAEARGDTNVARLHYRMAAKYGSEQAAARLTELTDQTTVARQP